MRNHRRFAMLAPALILVVTGAAPTVDAGGGFGIHVGGSGFGVSVGFGDWGVYTRSWSDPYWSIDFNATLAGYGQWVRVDGLGRVWRPSVAASWQPYTHGRWVSTGYGLTWVSYEPWGYVPHHYGSWANSSYGWVWVPGYSYSCANVTWVYNGGYVGWYARPPWGWSHAARGFNHGYRHGYRDGFNNGYGNGYSDGWRDARYATYVDWRHLGAENVARHRVAPSMASRSRLETSANAPTGREILRRGGPSIAKTQLSRRTVTVDGREVTIARPEGMARSIERHAADTVGRALSEEALQRRQPLVTPRPASASAAAGSSRSEGASRETRSLQPTRSNRASSSRSENSRLSEGLSHGRSSAAGSSETRPRARSSASSSGQRRQPGEVRQSRPHGNIDIGASGSQRSRSAPTASTRSSSSVPRRQEAERSRQASSSQRSRSQAQTRQSAAGSRQASSTQRRAAGSQQFRSRRDPSSDSTKPSDTKERKPEQRSRSRRR